MLSQYFDDLYDYDPLHLPPRIHHEFVPHLDLVRQPQIDEALLSLQDEDLRFPLLQGVRWGGLSPNFFS